MERGCAIGHTLSLEVMSQFYATHLGRVRKRARPTFGAGTLLKSDQIQTMYDVIRSVKRTSSRV